jgi:hypothetical protein
MLRTREERDQAIDELLRHARREKTRLVEEGARLSRLDPDQLPPEASRPSTDYPVRPVAHATAAQAPKGKSMPRQLRLKPSEGRPSQGYEGRRMRGLRQKVDRGEYRTVEEADAATPRRGPARGERP